MKRFLCVLCAMFLTFSVIAQEKILFSADVKADVDGYDYVSNFEITSESGYFTKSQLDIIKPNERGIRFIATDVPRDVTTSYIINVAYPSFLNDIEGAGVIYNAATIKSIKVTATTNRPYDEIILRYSTSPNGPIQEVLMPQNFNEIRSMEEFTLVYENLLYESDYKKREIKASPVLGAEADGIYLRGFRIKTNMPTGFYEYSPISVLYLKSVVVECDKAFTDAQLESARILKEEFGLNENAAAEKKAKTDIAEKNRLRDTEKSLMTAE